MSSIELNPSDKAKDVETFDAEAVNSKERRQLYAARKKIHPKRAAGTYRQLKWWIMAITLGIYYLTPWIRWDRGPEAPDQAVLVDLAGRRFYFFFIEIWPHEFFFVAGLLVMAGIGLFLITSTLGRAWCGYTCPQTVWVDLFLVVERFFEGDRNARIKLDSAPWTLDKICRRTAKNMVWLLIAVATGGAWIFYFADAPTLAVDVFTGQAASVAYMTIGVLTATTFVFGGYMREQVCTYMCPWPRIQAAMLDEHSLTVTYNGWRGEPRSRHAKKMRAAGETVGDCVDCNACVAVCPMGIDIRDGQQLECITCALCIDACDGVMQKLGLEKGLIAYATLKDYSANMALSERVPTCRSADGKLVDGMAHTTWRSFLRPRTLLYTVVYAAIGLALVYALLTRATLEINVIPDRNPTYVVLADGSIRNGYEVKILNMVGETRSFVIGIDGLEGATLKSANSDLDQSETIALEVKADELKAIKLFVRQSAEAVVPGKTEFSFTVRQLGGEDAASTATHFEAP